MSVCTCVFEWVYVIRARVIGFPIHGIKTRFRVFVLYDFISLCTERYLISLSSLNYDHMTIMITILPWIITTALTRSLARARLSIQFESFIVFNVFLLLLKSFCTSKGHGKFVYATKYSLIIRVFVRILM